MVLAISRALWASAVAANIPAHHPAYATLLAMSLGVELQVSSSPKKLAADKVRSFAVSFVEQGQEKISTRSGKRLTKDQVREMVLSPLTTHCGWLLPRGGVTSVDGLRDWERGHDVEKVERIDLHLPTFSEAAFENHVNDILLTLSQVLSPHFDGHLRP